MRSLAYALVIQRLRASGSPALAVLATISFVSSLGISIMLPLLPLYALSLGASPLQLGLMTSGFAVANGVAQFASGFLMDRYGARRFVVAVAGDLRAPFFIVAGTSALAFVAALFLPRPTPRPQDIGGSTSTGGRVWNRTVFVLLAGNLLLLIGFGGWITSYAPFVTTRLG